MKRLTFRRSCRTGVVRQRKLLRPALEQLGQERGDQLEGELAGYCRLRARGYRVIIRFFVERGRRVARCVFAERRSVVYEVFAEVLRHP